MPEGDPAMDVFDRELKARQRDRAAFLAREDDPLQAEVAENLLDRLEDCRRTFPVALNLGGALRAVQQRLKSGRGGIETLVHMDMSAAILARLRSGGLAGASGGTSSGNPADTKSGGRPAPATGTGQSPAAATEPHKSSVAPMETGQFRDTLNDRSFANGQGRGASGRMEEGCGKDAERNKEASNMEAGNMEAVAGGVVRQGGAGRQVADIGMRAGGGRPPVGNAREMFVVGDEELLPFRPQSLDLIISCLGLHWVNDLPGALVQCRHALRPDGLFLACMFGGNTLEELRISLTLAEQECEGGISARVSPFAQVRDAGNLLTRAGLALPTVDVDTITMRYPSAYDLIDHLRCMGEGNAVKVRRRMMRRDTARLAVKIYHDKFGDEDGSIPATFQVIYMAGWAPDPSQQVAKRRGSATVSFRDIAAAVEEATAEGGKGG